MSLRRLTAALSALALSAMATACVTGEQPSQPGSRSGLVTTSDRTGPQGEKAPDGGQLWLIPSSIPGLNMHATLFTPPGSGPFTLAVINHGTEQDQSRRAFMAMPSFPELTGWFLKHNYAVLVPLRPGHGATGGRYLEWQGPCAGADFVAAGNGAADSIAAAITYMTAQPMIRPTGVVVAGNSAGGWGALALSARNPASVRAVIAFAAGLGGHDRDLPLTNCAPDRLVAAAATFGRTSRIPTLWLYAENDTYFPPELSRRMADAFRAAGGRADFHMFPPVPGEGHSLIFAPGTPWAPKVDAFLQAAQSP